LPVGKLPAWTQILPRIFASAPRGDRSVALPGVGAGQQFLLELGADRERKNRFGRNPIENLSNVKLNQRPPFGLPEYLDPIKNVTDVLGR